MPWGIWQQSLAVVCLSGLCFLIITVTPLTDSTGELPRQKAAMAVDAADTCVGVLLGVSNVTTGLALGVITYLVIMVCRKRAAMADPVLYGLGGLFALMFPLDAVV